MEEVAVILSFEGHMAQVGEIELTDRNDLETTTRELIAGFHRMADEAEAELKEYLS